MMRFRLLKEIPRRPINYKSNLLLSLRFHALMYLKLLQNVLCISRTTIKMEAKTHFILAHFEAIKIWFFSQARLLQSIVLPAFKVMGKNQRKSFFHLHVKYEQIFKGKSDRSLCTIGKIQQFPAHFWLISSWLMLDFRTIFGLILFSTS